ncbi:MAG: energy transducer TonB [Fluviicola sp.]
MKLLLFFLLFGPTVFGQDTLQPPSMDTAYHSNKRLDAIAQANKVIPFYTPEAEFVGGTQALIKFVQDNLNYPQEAYEQRIEGKVYVRFTVNADGSLSEMEIVRSVHPLLDEEAIRLVSSMPNWIPGVWEGETVPVKVHLPVSFVIPKNEE